MVEEKSFGSVKITESPLDIELIELDLIEDLEKIHETHCEDDEPDSPQISFATISEEEKQKQLAGYRQVVKLILVNKIKVGWITATSRGMIVNIGFGLFKDHRRKGIMSQILSTVMPEIQGKYPNHDLSSATRTGNFSSIKSLKKGGFIQDDIITMPPLGKYKESVEYLSFKYPK